MSHNVLVVDDEPKLCDLLSSALSQNRIQVFTASNGLQALEVLEQEDIDLVISDWRMPGMDGPQLLAEIKQRYPNLPVIVMTAYSTVKTPYSPYVTAPTITSPSPLISTSWILRSAKPCSFATFCATTRACAPSWTSTSTSTA
jgi:Response regulator containing CheY-like receiver, AAA-type ATPase, and DNA-binding domains